jgi:hypothetical protein
MLAIIACSADERTVSAGEALVEADLVASFFCALR